jgi:hypothetical protein
MQADEGYRFGRSVALSENAEDRPDYLTIDGSSNYSMYMKYHLLITEVD